MKPTERITSRLPRHSSSVAAMLCALVTIVAVSASPALAEQGRIFEGSFGCEAGATGCTMPDPYPLAPDPWSAAVNDSTGDVYVADALNHRVEEFTGKGEFVLMFGKDVNLTEVITGGGEAKEDVCTAESLDVCQDGTPSSAPGGFESTGGAGASNAMFVAVDNSESPADPSKGDVYVADFEERGGPGNRVSKFDSSGQLVSSWGEGGQLNGSSVKQPPAEIAGPFGAMDGIAVDPFGNLWVANDKGAFEFNQEAGFKIDWGWPSVQSPGPFGVGVDSQDDIYELTLGGVLELDATGGRIGQIVEEASASLSGVAVDSATNDLYVHDSHNREQLQRYEPGCVPLERFPPRCTAAETFTSPHLESIGDGHGLAVNSGEGKTLYVTSSRMGEVQSYSVVTVPSVRTVVPSGVSATSATLQGTVNPSGEPVTECYFEWGETESYGNKAPCEKPGAAELGGSAEVPVHAEIKVQQGKTYHYRLVALNKNDALEPSASEGKDLVFGPPVVGGEWSFEVASSVANVRAEVNPENVDTRVRVEYGTGTEYGEETAVVDVGAGGGVERVPFELQGLAPGTVYHYRFVAENALGEAPGVDDRVLRTQGAGAFRLPDGRGWELVSPRDRHGASIEPLTSSYDAGGEIKAASDGGAVSYVTNIPVEDGIGGFPEFGQVLSARTASGWVSRGLGVPHSETIATGTSVDEGREYRYFSEDFSQAAVQPAGVFESCEDTLGAPRPCLSPEASEQTAFVQNLQSGVFTPLATGCPSAQEEAEGHPCPRAVAEHADVPAGTKFGIALSSSDPCPPINYCGPSFEAATPDFSHVVVASSVRLTEEAGATPGLYEWSAGKLAFVGAGGLGAGW